MWFRPYSSSRSRSAGISSPSFHSPSGTICPFRPIGQKNRCPLWVDTDEKLGFEAATKFARISFEGRKSNQRPSSWLSEPSERDFACRSASLRVDVTCVALKRKKYLAVGQKWSFSTLSARSGPFALQNRGLLSGVKRTSSRATKISGFDPKWTFVATKAVW